ncbi:hypothetical protein [Kribbella catacumbae]|uniref:hypothetical protein n=1 Tax=Kribbella catacumbae TaxID=460086 RepID=UPI0012F76300|nr:hypothetical protein [Kribbella catacumbae]
MTRVKDFCHGAAKILHAVLRDDFSRRRRAAPCRIEQVGQIEDLFHSPGQVEADQAESLFQPAGPGGAETLPTDPVRVDTARQLPETA